MKGKLIFVVISAALSILLCRYQFHYLLILAILSYHIFFLYKKETSLFFLCSISTFLFIGTYIVHDINNQTALKEGSYNESVVISSIPIIDGNQIKGQIQLPSKEKLTFSYTIQSHKEKEMLKNVKAGMSCHFEGELVEPKSPTMPNAFNYKQYLYDNKIHWQFQVGKIESCHEQNKWSYVLLSIRKTGLSFIEKHYPEASVGIVQALIFGERSLLDPDVESAYQELGIVHLLAISGLHVGIVVSGLYLIFIYSGFTHEKTRMILLIFLPIYTILTGAAPSVIRASFMVCLYFLLKHFKFNASPIDVISLTCLSLLFINPYYLFHIGFQLSYVVSFSLLLSFSIMEKFNHYIVNLGIVSLIAQLCAMPILFFNFYEVSLLSLPMNMLFVPLYSIVVLPLAILSAVITVVSQPIGEQFIYLFNEMLQYTHYFVLFSTSIPYTKLTLGRPSLLCLLGLISSIGFFFLQLEKFKNRRMLFVSIIFIIMVIVSQLLSSLVNPYGRVVFMDVGQGDSIFIQRPYNQGNYIIDTGGKLSFPKEKWQETKNTYSIASNVIGPYLKSLGITKLHAVFLTHGDMDHIGETLQLMEEVHVDQLIIPKGFVRGELEENILRKAKEKNIMINIVKGGDKVTLQNLSFHVLSPNEITDSKNDDSLVLYTRLGGLSWLFTGDAEIEAEEKLINMYPNLKVDILKLGHHGSKGSSSEQFLDHLSPNITVVSAGRNNRYQHPHIEVLERLGVRKIPLFRTDHHGAILYEFKGRKGTFFTHPPYDISES